MNIGATIKGLITGLLMIGTGLLLYFTGVDETSFIQYAGYLLYGTGIVWSVAPAAKPGVKFGELFTQGFRCFIVVTLLLTLFTFIFYNTNTKLIDEKAALTKQELLKTQQNRTPAEIDTMIATGRKNFPIMAASASIFQYLFIGAIVTMVVAGTIYLRNKRSE